MKYKMPTKSDLKGRSSTISNAFAISVTPFIRPTEEELATYYSLLGIKEGQCAYCLGDGNGRDHLKPLVNNGMPTGYITDIHNRFRVAKNAIVARDQKALRLGINQKRISFA